MSCGTLHREPFMHAACSHCHRSEPPARLPMSHTEHAKSLADQQLTPPISGQLPGRQVAQIVAGDDKPEVT